MRTILITLYMTLLLSGCATVPPAKPITAVKISLPESAQWKSLTDKSAGNQYLRERLYTGKTASGTEWLVVEQKFVLKKPVSAEKYIKTMFSLAKLMCTDVRYIEPSRIDAGGHETYAGLIMCAQQKGKDFGSFTHQRVISQDKVVYVITSELRTPASPKAGTLAFKKEAFKNMHAFMKQQAMSNKFIRESITVCTAAADNC